MESPRWIVTIGTDKTSKGKVTPSSQGSHSRTDTPINQSVLDILGISPSHDKNTGTDSKGKNRKGSKEASQPLIKPTPSDAHA